MAVYFAPLSPGACRYGAASGDRHRATLDMSGREEYGEYFGVLLQRAPAPPAQA